MNSSIVSPPIRGSSDAPPSDDGRCADAIMASCCGSIPVCRISLSISDKMEWMPSSGSSAFSTDVVGGDLIPDVGFRWQSTTYSSSLSSVPLLLLLFEVVVDLLLLLLLLVRRLFLAQRAGRSGTISSASSSSIYKRERNPPTRIGIDPASASQWKIDRF